MKYLYALLLLLMALFLAAFIHQNGQDVVLQYFQFKTVPLPLYLVVIIAFAGGYCLSLVLGFSSVVRNRVRLAGAKKEIKGLTKELEALKGKEETRSFGGSDSGGGAEPDGIRGGPRDAGLAESEEDDEDRLDAEGRGGKGEL